MSLKHYSGTFVEKQRKISISSQASGPTFTVKFLNIQIEGTKKPRIILLKMYKFYVFYTALFNIIV